MTVVSRSFPCGSWLKSLGSFKITGFCRHFCFLHPTDLISWLEVNISRRPLLIRKHISHNHIFISYIHIDIHIGRGMVPVVHSRCMRAGTFGKYKVGDLLYTDSRKLHTAYTWLKPGDASILLTEGSSWNDLALSMCHQFLFNLNSPIRDLRQLHFSVVQFAGRPPCTTSEDGSGCWGEGEGGGMLRWVRQNID